MLHSNDSYAIAEQIIGECLMDRFEQVILMQEIKKKSLPFTVNHTLATIQHLAQMEYIPRDNKNDDIYIDQEEDNREPQSIDIDTYLPKGCSVQYREQNMLNQSSTVDMISAANLNNSVGDAAEKRSIYSFRKPTNRGNISINNSQAKIPKIIPIEDNKISDIQDFIDDPVKQEKEYEVNDQIAAQRKRILKRDQELKKKEEEAKLKKKKKANESMTMQDLEIAMRVNPKQDQNFHIEPNGQIVLIKKPVAERFPKSFVNPLSYDISQQPSLTVESSFNKTIKEKRAHGMLKEQSIESIEHQLNESMQKTLQEQSKNVDSQFTNIERNLRIKKQVLLKDSNGMPMALSQAQIKGSKMRNHSQSNTMDGKTYTNKILERTQYSISDYREKFDSQNIALSKFQEIKQAKFLEFSIQKLNQTENNFEISQNFLTNPTIIDDLLTTERSGVLQKQSNIDQSQNHLRVNLGFQQTPQNILKDEQQQNKKVFMFDDNYSMQNQSKYNQKLGGQMKIKANPQLLIEDALSQNSVKTNSKMPNAFFLPSLFAATPQNILSNTISRKNSLSNRRQNKLDQSVVINSNTQLLLEQSFNQSTSSNLDQNNNLTLKSIVNSKRALGRLQNNIHLRTADNSPRQIQNTTNQTQQSKNALMNSSFQMGGHESINLRDDLENYLKNKMQPRQVLDQMKKRYRQQQEKMSIGREGAFGEITTVNVKSLIKQPQMPITARNALNVKGMRENEEEAKIRKEHKLPPPQLGRTMGHGILNQTLDSITHRSILLSKE
eukprot:403349964